MTVTITRPQRSLLFFLSASGFVAWFAGLGEPLAAQGIDGRPISSVALVTRESLPRVASIVERNPFDDTPLRGGRNAPGQRDVGRVASITTVFSEQPAVPDIPTSAAPPVTTLALAVKATIVGSNSVAYVANGTAMDIVRVGDTLGERHIAKIDLRGIAFADGSRLDLPGVISAAPRRTLPRTITLRIEDLRRLLVPASRATVPELRDSPAAPTALSSPAPAAYPSPGPLPTVDARGLPVGVNPTPDSRDPTPLLYPYPYAPPAARN